MPRLIASSIRLPRSGITTSGFTPSAFSMIAWSSPPFMSYRFNTVITRSAPVSPVTSCRIACVSRRLATSGVSTTTTCRAIMMIRCIAGGGGIGISATMKLNFCCSRSSTRATPGSVTATSASNASSAAISRNRGSTVIATRSRNSPSTRSGSSSAMRSPGPGRADSISAISPPCTWKSTSATCPFTVPMISYARFSAIELVPTPPRAPHTATRCPPRSDDTMVPPKCGSSSRCTTSRVSGFGRYSVTPRSCTSNR